MPRIPTRETPVYGNPPPVNEVSEMGGPVNTTARAGSSCKWGNC